MISLAVILESSEDGGYTAHVPTIPGCYGEGETVDGTLANLREAISLHLRPVDDDLILTGDETVVWLSMEWSGGPSVSDPAAIQPTEVHASRAKDRGQSTPSRSG